MLRQLSILATLTCLIISCGSFDGRDRTIEGNPRDSDTGPATPPPGPGDGTTPPPDGTTPQNQTPAEQPPAGTVSHPTLTRLAAHTGKERSLFISCLTVFLGNDGQEIHKLCNNKPEQIGQPQPITFDGFAGEAVVRLQMHVSRPTPDSNQACINKSPACEYGSPTLWHPQVVGTVSGDNIAVDSMFCFEYGKNSDGSKDETVIRGFFEDFYDLDYDDFNFSLALPVEAMLATRDGKYRINPGAPDSCRPGEKGLQRQVNFSPLSTQ